MFEWWRLQGRINAHREEHRNITVRMVLREKSHSDVKRKLVDGWLKRTSQFMKAECKYVNFWHKTEDWFWRTDIEQSFGFDKPSSQTSITHTYQKYKETKFADYDYIIPNKTVWGLNKWENKEKQAPQQDFVLVILDHLVGLCVVPYILPFCLFRTMSHIVGKLCKQKV